MKKIIKLAVKYSVSLIILAMAICTIVLSDGFDDRLYLFGFYAVGFAGMFLAILIAIIPVESCIDNKLK